MGLKCMLGLAACLNYNGSMIDEDDVSAIYYNCLMIEHYSSSSSSSSFLIDPSGSWGKAYGHADLLEDLGLEFDWKPNKKDYSTYELGLFREREIKDECARFRAKMGDMALWENKDKSNMP